MTLSDITPKAVDVEQVRSETRGHICDVQMLLRQVSHRLKYRADYHDQSKLFDDELIPAATEMRFQKDSGLEFIGYLDDNLRASITKPETDLHYSRNSHHPEHYRDGVNGMCLLDIIEMLADWRAHANSYGVSLKLDEAFRYFGIEDQLADVIRNTVKRLGWEN